MEGRCWKFGDNLSLDDDILEFSKVFVEGVRVSDPEFLKKHVFTNTPFCQRKLNDARKN